MSAELTIDEIAREVTSFTSLDWQRFVDRTGLDRIASLVSDPLFEDELIERKRAAESALRTIESKCRDRELKLAEINREIESRTAILQALVRASTPPEAQSA